MLRGVSYLPYFIIAEHICHWRKLACSILCGRGEKQRYLCLRLQIYTIPICYTFADETSIERTGIPKCTRYTVSLRYHCRYGTADIWRVHIINLFSPDLFNDACNISDYIASSDRTISEQWTAKGVEGSGSPNLTYYSGIYLRDWDKSRKTSVRLGGFRA
jgi:hypothetical protein